jgi:hypothetical protein
MLNHPDAYTEAGRKAAEARNQRDEARAQHWARYFSQMRGSEQDADRTEARRLYDEGYTQARNVPGAFSLP